MYQPQNIPIELRQLPQWVCAGLDKVPINPRTGQAADPMDVSTWGTFEEACHAGKPHIGFVFSKADPYCVIDLDDKADNPATDEQRKRFEKILASTNSYTEISQSGRGLHIIAKGSVETGMNRDHVEIYSWGRYMIFTGNVLRALPINDESKIVDRIYSEMKSQRPMMELEWVEPILSDREVYDMAAGAENSEKFLHLWNGTWRSIQEYNNDHSQADFGMLSMLCFYSRSNEQVIRLFQTSALGQRKKAYREDYLLRSLKKIRASQAVPLIDFSSLKFPSSSQPETPELQTVVADPVDISTIDAGDTVEFPPGLVGEIAHYILASSVRPVPHISLAAAIALVAGICGRSYNVSGSGLNHYVMLIAGTGRGKEDGPRGIDRLMGHVMAQCPVADRFIGPSAFASGQALVRALDDRPCFVSVLGEVGITLQQMTDKNANPALVQLKKVLLALYSKSGFGDVLQPSVYSDKDKNTKVIQAPNVSLLGEGSTETFFSNLETTHILDGLIPRFTIMHYKGKRQPRNPQAFAPPHPQTVDRVADLVTVASSMEQSTACSPVATDAEGLRMLDEFDSSCDERINGNQSQESSELWNRAHLKAWKLAALIAVGVNPHSPTITAEIAKWAIDFTMKEVNEIYQKFASGEVGQGNHRQEHDLREIILEYYQMDIRKRVGYNVPKKLAEQGNVYPLSYLKRRARMKGSFKNDRSGPDRALDSMLNLLCRDNTLVKVSPEQAIEQFGSRATLYVLGDSWGGE